MHVRLCLLTYHPSLALEEGNPEVLARLRQLRHVLLDALLRGVALSEDAVRAHNALDKVVPKALAGHRFGLLQVPDGEDCLIECWLAEGDLQGGGVPKEVHGFEFILLTRGQLAR